MYIPRNWEFGSALSKLRNFWVGFTPGIFSGRGRVQQIQLRTEGRENGDLEAVAP
jgi:hypothetical protein